MFKTTMTKRETQVYRHWLQMFVDRLGGEVAGLRAEALRPIGAEAAGGEAVHDADLGGRVADGALAMELLGPAEYALAEATAALARMDQGTFGKCEGCGKPIALARLDALPFARRCVRCARETESAAS